MNETDEFGRRRHHCGFQGVSHAPPAPPEPQRVGQRPIYSYGSLCDFMKAGTRVTIRDFNGVKHVGIIRSIAVESGNEPVRCWIVGLSHGPKICVYTE